MRSIKIFVLISITLIILIFIYEQEICFFFFEREAHALVFRSKYYLLALTILFDSFQMGLSSLLKALNKNYSVLSNYPLR